MTEMPPKDTPTTGTPRWVKVFGVIAVLVVVLVIVLVLTGRGGPHSPRRHSSPAEPTAATSTSDHTTPRLGATHSQT
jgi:hypothetical protein